MSVDTHRAKSATNMRGNDDSIALGNAVHRTTSFHDHSERLMADDATLDATHPTFVEMKVGAADRARGDAHQNVGRFSHLCIANFSYRDAPRFFENDCFHKVQIVAHRRAGAFAG